jgi:hypothetical protein
MEGLLNVNNLLPNRNSGVLETRKGTKRFGDLYKIGYKVKALHAFHQHYGVTNETGKQQLIAVLSDGTSAANNVQIHAIDVVTGESQRIDSNVSRPWRHEAARHWGETIDNAFYGGSELDPIYSYRPLFADGTVNPHPWDPDATMGQYTPNTWTTGTAYTVGTRVRDGDWVWVAIKAHTAGEHNRPKNGRNSEKNWEKVGKFIKAWATGTAYEAGDKVSYLVQNNPKFPRGYETSNRYSTFVATTKHTSAAGREPGTEYWEPARGPVSNVAVYHGKRLFVRDSDAGTGRVFYSSPVKGDGFWDPTEWSSDDYTKAGAFDVRTADGDDVRALTSLGDNLIILKRRSTWALAGINPGTWRLRRVGDAGCLVHRAVAEHEGLVYFLGDQGLKVTDGAILKEAPGAENFRNWMQKNVDISTNTANMFRIHMWTFDQKLWIAMPAGETVSANNVVVVYDPASQSLWKLDLSVNAAAISRKDRLDELFLAGVSPNGHVLQYNHPDAENLDDNGDALSTTSPINFLMRTGWLSFGIGREDRRIRRIWAALRATSKDITMKAFRQWNETIAWELTQNTGPGPVGHVEGRVMPDSHSVSFQIAGTAPASILGIALHTQTRHKRYHVT